MQMATPARGVRLLLTRADGVQTWSRPDVSGRFVFRNLPAGQHTIEAFATGFVFPHLLVEVSSKPGGRWRAWHATTARRAYLPLARAPLGLSAWLRSGSAQAPLLGAAFFGAFSTPPLNLFPPAPPPKIQYK